MKRQLLLFHFCIILYLPIAAQSYSQILNFCQSELIGSARMLGMGGAYSAVVEPVYAHALNPACMLDERYTLEVSAQGNLNFQDQLRGGFDNFGVSGNIGGFTFLFAYNHDKNFGRNTFDQSRIPHSLLEDMAASMRLSNLSPNEIPPNSTASDYLQEAAFYRSHLLETTNQYSKDYQPFSNEIRNNSLQIEQKGIIHNFTFGLGIQLFNGVLQLGLSGGTSSILYESMTTYHENFGKAGNYTIANQSGTKVTGGMFKIGALIRPTYSLNIGVYLHSPTWWTNTNTSSSTNINYNVHTTSSSYNGMEYAGQSLYTSPYAISTPLKVGIGASYDIDKKWLFSIDYEGQDYRSINIRQDDNLFANNESFQYQHVVRIGAEYTINKQFSVRGGYAFYSSPIQTEITSMRLPLSNNYYQLPFELYDHGRNYITAGLGYKLGIFFLDLAITHQIRESTILFNQTWSNSQIASTYSYPTANFIEQIPALHLALGVLF